MNSTVSVPGRLLQPSLMPGNYPRVFHLTGDALMSAQALLQALNYAGKACQKQTP
jgi:hypothetical protein